MSLLIWLVYENFWSFFVNWYPSSSFVSKAIDTVSIRGIFLVLLIITYLLLLKLYQFWIIFAQQMFLVSVRKRFILVLVQMVVLYAAITKYIHVLVRSDVWKCWVVDIYSCSNYFTSQLYTLFIVLYTWIVSVSICILLGKLLFALKFLYCDWYVVKCWWPNW